MASSLREAGVSITVTSLTDILSFGVGCSSNFPSVRNFCIYAVVAVSFVYIYQLTFFAGCMVISGSREDDASKNCITSKSIAYQQRVKMWKTDASPSVKCPDDRVDNHAVARFFRGSYTTFLINPITKGLVLISTAIYIGLAVWGCTKIKIGLQPIDLLPKVSYARTTLSLTEKYFSSYGDNLHLWFTNLTTLNYDSRFWLILDREVRRFENTTYSDFGDSWLRAFIIFARSADLTIAPENFTSLLKNTFLKKQFYEKYTRDIVFEGDKRLEAVRFLIRIRNVNLEKQNEMVQYFRHLADESALDAHVFMDSFHFVDQFDSITPSILTNLGQASAAVILASLLLIPKPMCSLWVCATIASINVGIFGYMSWWGVNLDFVSMVTITMSVGFSVDFSAHIAYHYAKDSGLSSVARIRDSMYVIGTPILQSAISTLIGILILIVVDNYVFRSFLKTSFLIVLLGVVHGLIILPVLLTIFHCDIESTEYGTGSSGENILKSSNGSSEHYSNSTRKASLVTTTAVYSFPIVPIGNGYNSQKFFKYWDRISKFEAELAKQRNFQLALTGVEKIKHQGRKQQNLVNLPNKDSHFSRKICGL